MGENSKIEWCDHTFNPWVGCDMQHEAVRVGKKISGRILDGRTHDGFPT